MCLPGCTLSLAAALSRAAAVISTLSSQYSSLSEVGLTKAGIY